jgi:predicted transcriptional regulator of viral defense system
MNTPSKSTEKRLFQIASEQQGYFTTAQAIEAGFQDATHPYHINNGDWIREWRGIYRITRYPRTDDGHYALWSLWSRNRKGIRQGVYSHQTALSLFELSDIMPDKIHMTVPYSFRRHSEIPGVIVLHHGMIMPREIEEREGYGVTKPIRTIVDLVMEESVSIDSIQQAYKEAKKRGLITEDEYKRYQRNPAINRKLKESLVGIA